MNSKKWKPEQLAKFRATMKARKLSTSSPVKIVSKDEKVVSSPTVTAIVLLREVERLIKIGALQRKKPDLTKAELLTLLALRELTEKQL